jgi:DNA repair exonuclease SbcCD ATPase subunit
MQLLRLEVKNWVHHRYRVCEFTRGLVAILGENGSGKSSLFGAIRWLLTGENPNFGVKADNISQYAKDGEPAYATLEFEHNGHIAVVTRHLLPEKEQSTLLVDGKEIGRGDKNVTAGIEKLLGVDAKFISRFIIVAQTEIFSFIDDNQTDTDKFFQRLFNTAKADKCQDVVGKGLAKITIPEIVRTSNELAASRDEQLREADALRDQISKLPQPENIVANIQAEQAIIKQWEARERSAGELSKIEEQLVRQQQQLETVTADGKQYEDDLTALTAAANGQEAAHAAARVALGHWASYKSVAKAKAKLQATRDEIADERARNVKPLEPGEPSAAQLRRDEDAVRRRIADTERFIKMFADDGIAECPTCHTPSAALAKQVAEHQAELPKLRETMAELNAAASKQTAAEKDWQHWQVREKEINAKEQSLASSESELLAVKPPEASEDELKQAVVDYEEFLRVKKEIEPLAHKAREDRAKITGTLTTLRERKKQLEEEISDIAVTQADAHLAQAKLNRMQEQIKAATDLAEQRSQFLSEARRLEDQYQQVYKQEQDAIRLRGWSSVAETARDALKNAPRLVAQRNLQRLESAINELLQVFRVNFVIKVATDGTPTFIAEFFDGRRQVAQRLSVGQKTVLALAFRVAVNAMFAEEIGLLALDEPTASLDQPRIQALAPVLEKLRELSTAKGLQCLLVTHATNLSHLFESAIELEAPELRHVQRS